MIARRRDLERLSVQGVGLALVGTGTGSLAQHHAAFDLRQADLSKASLPGASLRWANLQAADLFRANLRRARLGGADLQRAALTGATRSAAWSVFCSIPRQRGNLLICLSIVHCAYARQAPERVLEPTPHRVAVLYLRNPAQIIV